MKKTIVTTIIIVIAILAMVSLFAINPTKRNLNNLNTSSEKSIKEGIQEEITKEPQLPDGIQTSDNGSTISYQGQEGKNALELLKTKVQVETKDTSFGPQIMAINGVKATDKEFWLFSVNGQPASVGAHQYQTKDGDKIEWKLTGM